MHVLNLEAQTCLEAH